MGAIATAVASVATIADAAPECNPVPSEQGNVVVRFAVGEVQLPAALGIATVEDVGFQSDDLQDSVEAWLVETFELLAPAWSPPPAGRGMVDFSQVFRITVPDTTNVDSLTVRMRSHPRILNASPSRLWSTLSIDDPDYPSQWHLENTSQRRCSRKHTAVTGTLRIVPSGAGPPRSRCECRHSERQGVLVGHLR